ncbi:uncharacterized protein BDFB_011907 [Asbolus verrucosus]|uniref:Uncharacterized protein n=1 Tax=Asbolus verrucosus TaxID=1661398 RepID=A0A482V8V7_ASBVE|nr:uncharacterized protein BDFB_011907 [Asbolus verrucosus]
MSYKLSLSLIFILSTLFVRLIAEGPKDPGLIEHVEPNIDAIKGLICYQCRSITSELTPLCDKALFRLTTPEEKNNMSLQCPHYQGAYCFTKVIKRGKHKETLRGCSGSTDRNGNLMKVGSKSI